MSNDFSKAHFKKILTVFFVVFVATAAVAGLRGRQATTMSSTEAPITDEYCWFVGENKAACLREAASLGANCMWCEPDENKPGICLPRDESVEKCTSYEEQFEGHQVNTPTPSLWDAIKLMWTQPTTPSPEEQETDDMAEAIEELVQFYGRNMGGSSKSGKGSKGSKRY